MFGMKEDVSVVELPKGGEIVLHRLINEDKTTFGLPVVIAHGTLSNAEAVRDLGLYLAELGYDCWLLEWGGHGKSRAASKRQNFEYPAFHDVPAGINHVLSITQKPAVYWLSHSGGGHLPLMYLARFPDERSKFAGMVTLGSQATDAALGFKNKLSALYIGAISNLFRGVPQRCLPMKTVEGEPTNLLGQWAVWNLKQQWLGSDGLNYLVALSDITMPFFMIAGGNDVIAPKSGCFKFYERLGSEDKRWMECSTSQGFSKDYDHGQLIRGSAAQQEVFPEISQWLLERNN